MLTPPEIGAEISAARVSAALKRLAGEPRELWIGEIATQLYVKEATFRGWFHGRNAPELHNWMRLVAIFGPSFVTDCLAPVSVVGIAATDHAIIKSGELLKALQLLDPQLGYVSEKVRAVLADAEAAALHVVGDDGKAA